MRERDGHWGLPGMATRGERRRGCRGEGGGGGALCRQHDRRRRMVSWAARADRRRVRLGAIPRPGWRLRRPWAGGAGAHRHPAEPLWRRTCPSRRASARCQRSCRLMPHAASSAADGKTCRRSGLFQARAPPSHSGPDRPRRAGTETVAAPSRKSVYRSRRAGTATGRGRTRSGRREAGPPSPSSAQTASAAAVCSGTISARSAASSRAAAIASAAGQSWAAAPARSCL